MTATNNIIGTPLIEMNVTESTNNYAMQLVNNGSGAHGMAVFAHGQTGGKGQYGRKWTGNAGENIALSVIIETKHLHLPAQFALNASISLAVYDFFSFYAGDETSVKWPNDIYWRDRKAGGILIENQVTGKEWQWAIAGIGLNINQSAFENGLGKAVSLKQITGKQYMPLQLAAELCAYLEKRYRQFLNTDINDVFAAYNKILYKKNESVKLKKENAVFDCIIKGVNNQGQLEILRAGIDETFNAGEVQWVI